MKNLVLLLTFFVTLNTLSQSSNSIEKKVVNASRIEKSPTIDGVLDEVFWLGADEAKDFVMFRPGDGDKETDRKTVVKLAYDNDAIYFGATLYDPDPSSIPTQFMTRDNIGNADFFLISINPNNDGQNDTEFLVTSAGTQADAKITDEGEDWNWSAVWDSAVKINDDSWVVEMKIPYSALRFSNTNIQTWGLNIHRRIQSTNEQFVWNYIDKSSSLFTQFNGEVEGIKNINPPVRLSLSPYASLTQVFYDDESEFDYSYGLDLKYGISESFTLDATLIPDFGQTAFDEVVLNLGPFEQQYDEKRSFFTEGTELFEKGDLFYSRRVGNQPIGFWNAYDNLDENEEVVKNPHFVDMLNAVKVSGRTKGNLGIGFFNAITEKTSAKIKNLDTDEIREVVTEPFANYNVLVLDQQFNKTSSVTLVNTNVMREGHFRDANVSALLFNILNKKNTHFVDGGIKVSQVSNNGELEKGYFGDLSFGKSSGQLRYEIGGTKVNDSYEINDLAFNRRNNYKRFYSNISFRTFEPKGKFNNYGIYVWANANYLDKPNVYTESNVGFNMWANTKSRLGFRFNSNFNIGDSKDFYRPRTSDYSKYLKLNSSFNYNFRFNTDYSKKFAVNGRIFGFKRFGTKAHDYGFEINPRYLFSDKFQLRYGFEFDKRNNEIGWVSTLDNDDIIFGNRNSKTIINSISGNLNFSVKSALNLTFRHYWSPVKYDSNYFQLNDEGNLEYHDYSENHDINYNVWNLDFSYMWEFAPGSQFVALYRNSLFKYDDLSHLKFKKNLEQLFEEPMLHNLSVKFIYYLDYNKLKRKA